MPHSVSRAVTKRLKKLDIRLFLGKPVQAETKDALVVGGKPIRSHTVIWTAGTANNEFFKNNKFPLSPRFLSFGSQSTPWLPALAQTGGLVKGFYYVYLSHTEKTPLGMGVSPGVWGGREAPSLRFRLSSVKPMSKKEI